MGFWSWFPHNFADLLGYAGIIGGLVFNGLSIQSQTKERRISNMLMLVQNHREIWSDYYSQPDLWRVLDKAANVSAAPVTKAENAFVTTVIQHIYGVYQSIKAGLTVRPERMCCDICNLISMPVVKIVWNRIRRFQDEDFVTFIESCTHV
jgi:hypothetical protein